jgi:hypothetical protein
MSSIVLELQREVIREGCDVLNLLRKAHVIAAKLNLEKFDKWVLSELNGYKNKDSIPEYRSINGSLKGWNPYHGWLTVTLLDKSLEKVLCTKKEGESLGALIELEKKSDGFFLIYFNAELNSIVNSLREFPLPTRYSLHCSSHQIKSIVEHVKNTILEWTIRLETEGILGEEMQFNSEEKESAKRITQTINIYGSANVINGDAPNSAIVAGNENTVTYTSKVLNAVSEIESSLNNEDISSEDKETAIEMIADIKEKVSQEKKSSILRSAFIGLLDFVSGVGASLTAALIQSKIQGLF